VQQESFFQHAGITRPYLKSKVRPISLAAFRSPLPTTLHSHIPFYPHVCPRPFGWAGAGEGFSPPPAITFAVQGIRADKIFPNASFSAFAASASSDDFTGAFPSNMRAATMWPSAAMTFALISASASLSGALTI
jgi:hypothetical protein